MRTNILALPLFLLAPFAAAGSSNHKLAKRDQRRHIDKASEYQRDQEIVEYNHNATLSKRQTFTGRGTYYITGMGACGQWSNENEYIVALNSAQYGGGYPGPQCFKSITVQANGVTVGGVRIMDECPTCDWGGLDLSPGLFTRFADHSAGVITVNWWFEGSNPQPQPTTTQQPTTTWTPPTTTWEPPSSTWSPPAPPSSTWTPPSSSSTVASTTTTPPPASSSTTTSSSSSSSSTTFSSSATFNATANPFAVVSSYNGTASSTSVSSTSASASASASATVSGTGATVGNGPALTVQGNNLEALNGLVTNYGQIIVVGASNP